jgi:amino acid transporter
MADDKIDGAMTKRIGRVAMQGWISLIFWMSIGLLLETLMAYKSPGYLDDQQRRELFRLAHAHGALLGLVLVVASFWVKQAGVAVSRAAVGTLRLGAVILPVGFLLAGVWHPEGDPGPTIWLVPAGAVSLLFGLISIARPSRSE